MARRIRNSIEKPGHVYPEQRRKILRRLEGLPDETRIPPFSEWAEENRYISPGASPYYGMHNRETAPHFVEILERLHPEDPATWITVMKSVQSTATYHAECAMGAWIRYKIGSIGYYTATQDLAKIRSSANIDTMIDDSGLAELVKPHSQRNNRKKADSTLYKEFVGGIKLTINSYGSIGGMKSNTIPFMILDEIDEAADELKGQGDILAILEGRTIAVRHPKIFVMSTPSAMETSKIYRLFKQGDQRYYYVPCPICGEYQTLVLKSRKMEYGLTFTREKDTKSGKKILIPETVRYICQHCGKEFRESKKQEMLLAGEWRPTATPADAHRTSYHVNGLYSPEMFLSWERICRQFILCNFGDDLLRFKDFTINYLGKPWARIDAQKSWQDLKSRADDYTMGEVPPGGLRLYAGVDVQADRLEMAVWAVGRGMERWLVDYQIFFGDTANLNDAAWTALHQYVYSRVYNLPLSEGVASVYISRIGVDCGWDPKENRDKDWDAKGHTVFNFVASRQDRFVAVRGAGEIKGAFDIIKASRIGGDHALTRRYDVNTSVIKEIIIRNIEQPSGPQAMHFPKWQEDNGVRRAIPDNIFQQFLSERYQEISPGKMGWKKLQARNEVWDTSIYAFALMYMDNLQTWDDTVWDQYESGLAD